MPKDIDWDSLGMSLIVGIIAGIFVGGIGQYLTAILQQ